MTISRCFLPSRLIPFACMAVVGLAALGCQSVAVAMDAPLAYDQAAAPNTAVSSFCLAQARDAVVWGTLPSLLCVPDNPYWLRSGGAYPFAYYGRSHGRRWHGPGWHRFGGYPGRGFGGWRGGWRGGRGGRR